MALVPFLHGDTVSPTKKCGGLNIIVESGGTVCFLLYLFEVYVLCKYGTSEVQNLVTARGDIVQAFKMRYYFPMLNQSKCNWCPVFTSFESLQFPIKVFMKARCQGI
jgi:hypothetical protein